MNPRLIDKFKMLHVSQTSQDFLTKRLLKEVLFTYFSELGPTDSCFNLLISIFFLLFFRSFITLSRCAFRAMDRRAEL